MECLAEPMSAYPFHHLRELLERLDILRNNDSFCDVTIAVKDKEFKAHRAVLAAASPFFLALLTSDMKERNEQLIRVDLEGVVLGVRLPKMSRATAHTVSAVVVPVVPAVAV